MITFKDGVIIHWNPALDKIQRIATRVFERHKLDVVVTSGRDGTHQGSKGRPSLHPQDRALDIRTWHITGQPNPCLSPMERSEICVKIEENLRKTLGPRFDVVFETDVFLEGKHVRVQHFHIEEDPT